MTSDMETFERVLAARHSCRAFCPDPIPDEMTRRIAMAARCTMRVRARPP